MKTNEMNEQKCKKKNYTGYSAICFWVLFRWCCSGVAYSILNLFSMIVLCFDRMFPFFYCMRHAVTEHTFVQQRWAIKKSKKKKKRLEQYSIDNVNTINLYRYCWCRNAHLFLRFFERINWPWCVLCIRRYFPFSFSW